MGRISEELGRERKQYAWEFHAFYKDGSIMAEAYSDADLGEFLDMCEEFLHGLAGIAGSAEVTDSNGEVVKSWRW